MVKSETESLWSMLATIHLVICALPVHALLILTYVVESLSRNIIDAVKYLIGAVMWLAMPKSSRSAFRKYGYFMPEDMPVEALVESCKLIPKKFKQFTLPETAKKMNGVTGGAVRWESEDTLVALTLDYSLDVQPSPEEHLDRLRSGGEYSIQRTMLCTSIQMPEVVEPKGRSRNQDNEEPTRIHDFDADIGDGSSRESV